MTFASGHRSAVVSKTVITLYDDGRIVGVVTGSPEQARKWVRGEFVEFTKWVFRG